MIYIDDSKIHGKGVFTDEDIERNTVIEKIPYIEIIRDEKIPNSLKKYTFGLKNSNLCLMMSKSSFLNHSDKPNSEIIENKGELELISLNHICKGEELTIKYK